MLTTRTPLLSNGLKERCCVVSPPQSSKIPAAEGDGHGQDGEQHEVRVVEEEEVEAGVRGPHLQLNSTATK